nr:Regulatory protein, MerR [Kibdelosporangium sp. MJ126-NF4]
MRVAELGLRTGVSIPTIKYYLREGLLPQGERTSPNQARYGDEHIRRLRMIKVLTEVGGLSIAAVKYVFAAMPWEQGEHATQAPGDAWPAAEQHVKEVLAASEWHADLDDDPGRTLVAAVAALHELGRSDLAGMLERCATVVAELARIDTDPDDTEARVLTLVLGDVVLAALRRLVSRKDTPTLTGIPLPGKPYSPNASTCER